MTELARGSLQVDRLRRTTIPRDILTAAGIPPGSALVAHVDERGRIVLESPQLLLEQLQDAIAAGIAARATSDATAEGRDPAQEPAGSMAEELLAERAAEALAEADDDDPAGSPVDDSAGGLPRDPGGASARAEVNGDGPA